MGSKIIGIDIGGTNIDIGLVDLEGRVEAVTQTPTNSSQGPEQCVERLAAAAKKMMDDAGVDHSMVLGIGIGSPGPLDIKAGKMVDSPNFPSAWSGYPLKDEIARQIGFRAEIDNDANAAALAEGWVGAAKGIGNYLVLTLGTGVGGGAVADGRIVRGIDGFGGELGHICIYPDGRPCGCGGRGCLESYASATAVAAQGKALLNGESGPEEVTARKVFELAESGNATALGIVAQAGEALGIGIGSLLNAFNPQMVVLAGRMAQSFPLMRPHIEKGAREHSYRQTFQNAVICASPLVEKAGIIGATAVFAYERKASGAA